MAGILIIAHAPFASALRDCISHIYGGLPARIGVIDVVPESDPVQLVDTARAEIERLKECNGALVLTDMCGATPANIAACLASLPDVRVLAGVNLPMLVRAVCYRSIPLDTLVDKAIAGGVKGVQALAPGSFGCGNTPCVLPPCAELPRAGSPCEPSGVDAPVAASSSPSVPCLSESHASTRNHNR